MLLEVKNLSVKIKKSGKEIVKNTWNLKRKFRSKWRNNIWWKKFTNSKKRRKQRY